jgi:hypothetical protein
MAFTVVLAISASSNSYPKPKAEGTIKETAARRKRNGRREGESQEVATGVSEARSHQRRGKKTPTFVTLQKHGRETRSTNLALHVFRSAEAFWNVVKRSVPWSCRTEPKTPWGVPAAKVARANQELTRCGCTQFDWMAEIG